jgi:hypothetical protein
VDHETIYNREVAWLNKPENKMWRSLLYNELDQWWSVHPPSSKKRKSISNAMGATVIYDDDRAWTTSWTPGPLAAGAASQAGARGSTKLSTLGRRRR